MTYPNLNFELIENIVQQYINISCTTSSTVSVDDIIKSLKYKTLNPIRRENELSLESKIKNYSMALDRNKIEFYRYVANVLSSWERMNDISKL